MALRFSHYVYKFFFINDNGRWQETLEFYKDADEFKKCYPDVKAFMTGTERIAVHSENEHENEGCI